MRGSLWHRASVSRIAAQIARVNYLRSASNEMTTIARSEAHGKSYRLMRKLLVAPALCRGLTCAWLYDARCIRAVCLKADINLNQGTNYAGRNNLSPFRCCQASFLPEFSPDDRHGNATDYLGLINRIVPSTLERGSHIDREPRENNVPIFYVFLRRRK